MEIYPASPSLRNSRHSELSNIEEEFSSSKVSQPIDDQSKSYRTISLMETTKNVERAEEKPRLKLDQPFLYFVRHNPTGLILHIGRFNPRLI